MALLNFCSLDISIRDCLSAAMKCLIHPHSLALHSTLIPSFPNVLLLYILNAATLSLPSCPPPPTPTPPALDHLQHVSPPPQLLPLLHLITSNMSCLTNVSIISLISCSASLFPCLNPSFLPFPTSLPSLFLPRFLPQIHPLALPLPLPPYQPTFRPTPEPTDSLSSPPSLPPPCLSCASLSPSHSLSPQPHPSLLASFSPSLPLFNIVYDLLL